MVVVAATGAGLVVACGAVSHLAGEGGAKLVSNCLSHDTSLLSFNTASFSSATERAVVTAALAATGVLATQVAVHSSGTDKRDNFSFINPDTLLM